MRIVGNIMDMNLKEFYDGYVIPEHIKVLHLNNPTYTSNRSSCIFPKWLKFIVYTASSGTLMTTKDNKIPIILNPQHMGFYCANTNCGYNVCTSKFTGTLIVGTLQDLDPLTFDDLVLIEKNNKLTDVIQLIERVFAKKRCYGRSIGVYMDRQYYLTELTDVEFADVDLTNILGRYCKDDFNHIDSDNMGFRTSTIEQWLLTKKLQLTNKEGYMKASYGIIIRGAPALPNPQASSADSI